MAKKDFAAEMGKRGTLDTLTNTNILTVTSRKGQAPASEEEQAQRIAEGRTQGRLGCHAPAVRVNLTLTPENHHFVKVMAGISGISITKFLNDCLETYRTEHSETFAQAEALVKAMKK